MKPKAAVAANPPPFTAAVPVPALARSPHSLTPSLRAHQSPPCTLRAASGVHDTAAGKKGANVGADERERAELNCGFGAVR